MPKAKDLLATALRLDDTNADAHSLLGIITGIMTTIGLRLRERISEQSSSRPQARSPTAITDTCFFGRRGSTKPSGN